MKTALLMSGGIDSYIGKYFLKPNVSIYMDLKTKYSEAEKHFIRKYNPDTKIVDMLSFLGSYEREDAHVPFRNLILILGILLEYDADVVYLCGVKDDRVSDKNPQIMRQTSEVLSVMAERDITILSPFWNYTKKDICKLYANEQPAEDLVNKTYSCYEGELEECGKCAACFRKRVAIYTSTGIYLPFYNKEMINKYINNMNLYDMQRQDNMRKYIKRWETQ